MKKKVARLVPLGSSGKCAIVDDCDYADVSRFKWTCVNEDRASYAYCHVTIGRLSGKRQTRSMQLHRLIMRPPKGLEVDHKDHDGLDCRRANMRICTKAQNQQNGRSKIGSSSSFKGVSWHKRASKWEACLKDKKKIYLGLFDDELAAARAYDRAALKYFGEFACTNLPKEEYL